MKLKLILFFVLGIFLLALMFGCSTAPIYDVNDDNFSVVNNEAWLYNNYVEESGEELSSTDSKAWGVHFNFTSIFMMFKVATIRSPESDGQTLQATDVAIAGDGNNAYAYVSYAMAGSDFYGGMDIVQLKHGFFPKLKSRVISKKEDVNSVTYDSLTNKIFLGLHVNPDVYGLDTESGYHGAYLRSIELKSNYKVKVESGEMVTQGIALQSYAANDAAIMNDKVLVPVGAAGGGVEIRNTSDITQSIKFISGITDTRAVATYDENGDGTIDGFLVYQGPDGTSGAKLYKYKTDGTLADTPNEYDFPSTITAVETKSTIETHGNVAFVAASDGGVFAINISTMTEIFNIPNPYPNDLGLAEDKVTANAVTVSTLKGSTGKSILFIANGEFGVRAYELGFDIESITDVASALSGFDYTTSYLGYLNLGTGNSANSVLYKDGYLFVGTGLGGLNVLYVIDYSFGLGHRPHWARPTL